MTPQLNQPTDTNIDAELDRLTYSAYLLTLDTGLALSVVMAALDDSLNELSDDTSLLGRTVQLSLQQLRSESHSGCDRVSSAAEVALYGDYQVPSSSRMLRMNEDSGSNIILLLNSGSRIAFVLHHILGYSIRKAAGVAQTTEKECRAHLREAYLQLASLKIGPEALAIPLWPPRVRNWAYQLGEMGFRAYLFDCVCAHTKWAKLRPLRICLCRVSWLPSRLRNGFHGGNTGYARLFLPD